MPGHSGAKALVTTMYLRVLAEVGELGDSRLATGPPREAKTGIISFEGAITEEETTEDQFGQAGNR
jgi:hypothetical protein